MSNAELKLHEPVIGDDFDMQTYGAATERVFRGDGEIAPSTARARRPQREPRGRADHREMSREPRRAASTAPIHETERSRIDADGVRTVKIRGQAQAPRSRAQSLYARPMARYDQHPDRAAQWALFLGVFMVVVAIVTGS